MKKTILILLPAILFIVSCKKEPTCSDGILNQDEVQLDCGGTTCTPCPIEYPETGTHGLNLLYGEDTLMVTGAGNSLRAVIPNGSSLKLEFIRISGGVWGYHLGTEVGWSITTYANNRQLFDAINGGTTELKIVNFNGAGTPESFIIKFIDSP